MDTATSLDQFLAAAEPGARHAVTIGNFDGVHAGHRELIRVTREKAAARGVPSIAVTFDPHPVHVVRGIASPDTITPLPRKLELLTETGIDAVLVLPFTAAMAGTSAEAFVRHVLVDGLAVTDLVTGFNFALGKNRSGNFSTLTTLGDTFGFAVTQVPPVIIGRETASSSLVREHIRSGDMDKAALLLGRMHSVDGTIVHGEGRGRKLGFPTANIQYDSSLLPALGGYSTWLRVYDPERPERFETRMSMTSVGTNPTFGGAALTLETHVLDYSGDLYGRRVRLFFASRLRGQIQFKSPHDLIQRLHLDADHAREELQRGAFKPIE